jgi:signal transduction histidine kinase
MSTLLNDLLELSRVGRAGNVHAVVRLADVANVAVELLQGRIAQRGARVVVATDLPETVGDRTRLIQVLQNLIENAIKYAGDEPNPTVTIGTRPDPHAAILLVADQGIGVDPRYAERIFGLFEKLDPRADGTGVGLALVRRIVEQHHGRVWVESEGHGKGSTFVVQLPRHAAGS